MTEGEKLIPIDISGEMKPAYIDYSMPVIVSCVLPDVRDGLRPIHRRVSYGMYDMGVLSNRAYKKSAAIVGEVLDKYHPHGDTAAYDTIVRMVQYWSLRYILVDRQDNFGSMGGDSPAAMRYTETCMRKFSEDMLNDIDKETADHQPTHDGSREEPTVLPTHIPNLLVNGSTDITVGIATNTTSHNLSEVIGGTITYTDNNDIETDELIRYIRTPDLPTGGVIYGYEGVEGTFKTSRGRVTVRTKTEFQEVEGRERIIVTEVPYQVGTSVLLKKTSDLVKGGKPEGITDVRDESACGKIRVVYFSKRDAVPDVVLNSLFKHIGPQTSFSVNNTALVKGCPELLNLKDLIYRFVEYRHEVVYRRTDLKSRKTKERVRILKGFMKVMVTEDTMGKAIGIIRLHDKLKGDLIAEFDLTNAQAEAILVLALRRINKAFILQAKEEYEQKLAKVRDFEDTLARKERRVEVIKQELLEIKERYGDEHRSVTEHAGGEFNVENTIPDDKMAITISHVDYAKRTPLGGYKTRSRGGVGQETFTTCGQDFLKHLFVSLNCQCLLLFTQKGKCFWMHMYEIPEGSKAAEGRTVQNLINMEQDDKIKAFVSVQSLKDEDYISSNYLTMATKQGIVKKALLKERSRLRQNSISAITIKEGDELIEARLTLGSGQLMLTVKSGRTIRFGEDKMHAVGRNSQGVYGIDLDTETDEVVGMIAVENPLEETVLVISGNGYDRRSYIDNPKIHETVYRITNHGGKGVKTTSITDKIRQLIAIKSVAEGEDSMIVSKSGIAIYPSIGTLRIPGRITQGVELINIKGENSVTAVIRVMKKDDDDNNVAEEVEVSTKGQRSVFIINKEGSSGGYFTFP